MHTAYGSPERYDKEETKKEFLRQPSMIVSQGMINETEWMSEISQYPTPHHFTRVSPGLVPLLHSEPDPPTGSTRLESALMSIPALKRGRPTDEIYVCQACFSLDCASSVRHSVDMLGAVFHFFVRSGLGLLGYPFIEFGLMLAKYLD
jgi:hypothetical protein